MSGWNGSSSGGSAPTPPCGKELRVEVRLKNNILWAAINSGYRSVLDFASRAKVGYAIVYDLINLRQSPKTHSPGSGGWVATPVWRKPATIISKALGIPPEVLYPEDLYAHPEVPKHMAKAMDLSAAKAYWLAGGQQQRQLTYDDEARTEEVEKALETLNEREAKILRLHFGIGGGTPRTLREIGDIFGVGQERVRQIEAKAIRKLRHPTRSRRLREYLDPEVVNA